MHSDDEPQETCSLAQFPPPAVAVLMRRPSSRSIKRYLSATLLVLASGLTINSGSRTWANSTRMAEAGDSVNTTYEIMANLDSIVLEIQSMESEGRGYVITGNKKYLG